MMISKPLRGIQTIFHDFLKPKDAFSTFIQIINTYYGSTYSCKEFWKKLRNDWTDLVRKKKKNPIVEEHM